MYGCSNIEANRAIPCEKTLQNWMSKAGFYHIKQSDNEVFEKEVALIIDESVRVGSEKLFLALLIPVNKVKNAILSFTDVRIFYLKGSESWKSDKIAKALKFRNCFDK